MDDLTQDVVAECRGNLRPSVGRILERARRSGVVSISPDARGRSTFELSVNLARVYGLEKILVIPDAREPVQTQREVEICLGIAVALLLNDNLKPGATICVGSGDTVSQVLARTGLSTVAPQHVVSLTGGVDSFVRVKSRNLGEDLVE